MIPFTFEKVKKLDMDWLNSVNIKEDDLDTAEFSDEKKIKEHLTESWIAKMITFIDLASLDGDEIPENIKDLCKMAALPWHNVPNDGSHNPKPPGLKGLHCATVCIYPLKVQVAVKALIAIGAQQTVKIAAVAAGFPSGQYPLNTRLGEIYFAVTAGAQEVDVVIDRSLVLQGLWCKLYNDLVEMRRSSGNACLKVILSVTECGGWNNIYKACIVAMTAGANFIKTSTGKEARHATLTEGLIMCQAIKEFHERTGVKTGLKPAGKISSLEKALGWMIMVKEVLGEEWLNPSLFRIGASWNSSLIKEGVSFLRAQPTRSGAQAL